MMGWLFIPVWTALEIAFAHLFFTSFLPITRRRDEVWGLVIAAWLLTAVFGLLGVDGVYGYLMYLLMAALLLLVVHEERGLRGLCLLVFALFIPVVVDGAVLYWAAELGGLSHQLAVTGGKALPGALVLILRCSGLLAAPRQGDEADRDALLLRQHMEMQQESMNALEQNYRMQRKSAHEFEHHLQVLRDLLDRGEGDAARDYLDRLKKNRSIHVMSVSSRHPVVDVILNQKYQTARENDIQMQIQVNDLSAVDIPTDSLVVVLTNLLDNAIEACRRVDGCREIFCSVLHDDGLYLSIRNTSEPVEVVDGAIPTSKEDSLSHGFGLLSVGYVLDRLEAAYTFGYEDGWFRFAAEIELK